MGEESGPLEAVVVQRIPLKRSLDPTPWSGMPPAVLDKHTPEGRKFRTRITVLSGSYENHRRLGELVGNHGWEGVRVEVHRDAPLTTGVLRDEPFLFPM